MPHYSCLNCNFSTKLKTDYRRHQQTKKHLNNTKDLPSINQEKPLNISLMSQNEPQMSQNEPQMSQNEPQMSQPKIYNCDFCNHEFKTDANKRRHEKYRCKENEGLMIQLLNEKDNTIRKMEKEKKIMYKKMSELIEKVGDTNIQNNIILNNFGNEDMTHITDIIKNHLMSIPYGMVPKLIEAVHFNDNKPENKNIILPNKKENFVKVYQDNKWVYKKKDDTIMDLIDCKYNLMDEHYETIDNAPTNIKPHIKSNFVKFKKLYNEGDKELIESIRKECDIVLLNNKDNI